MSETSTTAFLIHALPTDVLDRVRADGPDASGRTAERLTAGGGEPVRCCLRDSAPGEPLLLFGYEPPLPAPSPYREIGAVYVHAEPCAGPADATAYPAEWRSRPQVLRAYDARGWIHPATTVHDGTDPEGELARALAAPGVVEVHSRNIAYGCFMFAVTRPGVAGLTAGSATARR